jgi:hypothetical protein
MIEVYALVAVALLVAGGTLGVLGAICLGIRRDERERRRARENPDPIVRFAREACGYGVRFAE